jgi:oligogalacturonide lyase
MNFLANISMAFLIAATLCGLDHPLRAQQTLVGKVYASEKQSVDNREYGYEVTQWTQNGSNNHLYFNVESFIDATHFMFYSDRSGSMNMFVMDMITGAMTQMTDERDLTQEAWHLPQFHTVWFLTKKELKSLNTITFAVRSVYKFDSGKPQSFAITCDGKYCVYSINEHPGFSVNHSTGPYALFRLDLNTKEVKQISPNLGFKIGHVMTSPVDPAMLSYCWQHVYDKGAPGMVGNTPQRIWWNNIEGTDGGPVGVQEFGLHRTHEFWFPDGKHIGYSARYHFGPNKGQQFIGITTPDGKDNFMMPVPVSSSHNQIYADNKHWVCDLYDGLHLVLFTIEGKEIVKKEVLFRHDSSMKGDATHPHPHFSPDGNSILFSSDRTGKPEVYTVKVGIHGE